MAKPAYETHEHDVIVIGAGGAGLRAADPSATRPGRGRAILAACLEDPAGEDHDEDLAPSIG